MGMEIQNSDYGFASWIDNIKEASKGNRVISGCATSQRAAGANMSVDVATGQITVSGVNSNISGINVIISSAETTLSRIDSIFLSGTSAIYGKGDALINPYPANLPTQNLLAATFRIDSGTTTVTNAMISDCRIIREEIVPFGTVSSSGKVPTISFTASTSYVGLSTPISTTHSVISGSTYFIIAFARNWDGGGGSTATMGINANGIIRAESAQVGGSIANAATMFAAYVSSGTETQTFAINHKSSAGTANTGDGQIAIYTV